MSKEITVTYIVYGCNDEGKPQVDSMFRDERLACEYACAQEGKIHYNLPLVERRTDWYDTGNKQTCQGHEFLERGYIYYLAKGIKR